jgi:hypothetical protein
MHVKRENIHIYISSIKCISVCIILLKDIYITLQLNLKCKFFAVRDSLTSQKKARTNQASLSSYPQPGRVSLFLPRPAPPLPRRAARNPTSTDLSSPTARGRGWRRPEGRAAAWTPRFSTTSSAACSRCAPRA